MAYLYFHSIKATSIGVDILDLDENYSYNDRTVIWYVSTDAEEPRTYVKKNQQMMDKQLEEFSGVVTGLTRNTTYYIRAVVVNYAETLSVIDGQGAVTTASSVTGEKYPIIVSTSVTQTGFDFIDVTYTFTVDNAYMGYCQYYVYINGKEVDRNITQIQNGTFITQTFSGTVNADRYGLCTWEIVFINIVDGKELSYSVSGTVFLDSESIHIYDKPNCVLERSWEQKYILSSENYTPLNGTNNEFICLSYPHIKADSWNQFGNDINIVRMKAGFDSYNFTPANINNKITHTLWNQFVDAVRPLTDIDISGYMASKNKEMTESFFSDFELLVQNINDTLFA